jgi:hypothetical protein
MFNDQRHRETFLNLCPDKLFTDAEWIAPVFILTSDEELRRKTVHHINPSRRSIDWDAIVSTDFGSGHRAALYWAFSLWAGNSWPTDEGFIDTMDMAYYMDYDLRKTATIALMLRWKLSSVKL